MFKTIAVDEEKIKKGIFHCLLHTKIYISISYFDVNVSLLVICYRKRMFRQNKPENTGRN